MAPTPRQRTALVIGAIAAGTLAVAGIAALAGRAWIAKEWGHRPLDAFYEPPFDLPPGAAAVPGAIVRIEQLPGAPEGVLAWRVVHLYTDRQGHLQPVSAVLAVPDAPAPAGGWPLATLAHGTIGLNRESAPSTAPLNPWIPPHWLPPHIPGQALSGFEAIALPFLRAGFAVAASDYPGLGVDGLTNYLIGRTEATAVLDAVRAFRQSGVAPLSGVTVIWGHSQGGHAALFALQEAAGYAPELDVRGGVVLAPAAEPVALFESIYQANAPGALTGLALMVAASYARNYPGLDLAQLVAPDALEMVPVIFQSGVMTLVKAFRERRPQDVFLVDLATVPAFLEIARENTPRIGPLPGEVLLLQGLADQVITPSTNVDFAQQLKEAGVSLTFVPESGLDHLGIAEQTMDRQIAFARRIAGLDPA